MHVARNDNTMAFLPLQKETGMDYHVHAEASAAPFRRYPGLAHFKIIHMKALVFDRIGSPLDVLRIEDVPVPPINDNEVLIRMTASSINPGDFLFIQNLYPDPKKPKFPCQIAGNHGAGYVEKCGKNVRVKAGQFVAFSFYSTWAEYAVVPAEWLVPLPANFPAGKAAQLVNLVTAWDLLEMVSRPEAWLAITAGHSTVSLFLLQLAARKGLRTLPIVRHESPDLDLRALGATAVISLSILPDLPQALQRATGGHGLDAVVDGVGGTNAKRLIENLAPGGSFVIHGGFSDETYPVHNFDFLMKAATLRTYIYRFFFEPPKPSDATMLRELIKATADGDFVAPIAAEHPLEDFRQAIEGSLQHPPRGKRIFRMHAG
jgi:NADPH:quinone reductase-like Zn-dependent oxidoreductase